MALDLQLMKHLPQLQTFGGWGIASPGAFAYDLSRASAWKLARKSGVIRLGAAPSSGDDTRPIVPRYRHVTRPSWSGKASYLALRGDKKQLEDVPSPFGGAKGLQFVDNTSENPHAFAVLSALGVNESLAFRATVFEQTAKDDEDSDEAEAAEPRGHVWHLRLGKAGAGLLFQIRDGSPEIARLSPTWTRGGEDNLRALWALDEPTSEEEAEIETLQKQLYSDFESLSFERSTGRDEWLGTAFFITLIPEPRGALHIVLEGADATCIEFSDITATRDLGTLWSEGAALEVGATGGAWIFQPLGVEFRQPALEYGPYSNGLLAADWNSAQFSASSFSQKKANEDGEIEPIASVTFEKTSVEGKEKQFRFKAQFASTDPRYCAWLYGLSARLENGPRSGLSQNQVSFDSSNPNHLPSFLTPDSKPILDCEISCDENNRRSATITMRDIGGRTLQSINYGIDGLVGRAANLFIAGGAAITQGLIVRGRLDDAAHFAQPLNDGAPRRFPIDVSKAKTRAELEMTDGNTILEETLCDPAIISDGKHLGYAIRQRLRLAGYSDAEMARVPANLGPLLPKAAPGESWACVSDESESVSASIDGLLDRFGLGLRFYQDVNGVWVLERRPTAPRAAFVSQSNLNDPHLKRGGSRYVVLSPLDWERDHSGFFNAFRVVGGANGEISRDWVDTHSMQTSLGAGEDAQPQVHPRWVGRPKTYPTLRDTGLRTLGAVLYALRSLVDRYNRPGKFATFQTYFVEHFYAGDLITLDGVLCEIVSYEASTKTDRMQIRVREVI